MSFTPEDVRAVAFKRSAIGKRGYDEGEVDSFLETVEEELRRLIQQVEVVPEQSRGSQETPADDGTGHTDGHIRAVRVLQAAEFTASRLTQEAAAECEKSLEDARHRSAALIAEATRRAAAIEQDARIAASQLENESKARNDDMIGGLVQRRAALEQEVAKLSTYREEMNRQLYDVIGKHVALLEQLDADHQGLPLVADVSADRAAA